jgi:hypothetical protein
MKNKVLAHAIRFSIGLIVADILLNKVVHNVEGYNWLDATFKTVFTLLFFAFIYGKNLVEKSKDSDKPKQLGKMPLEDPFKSDKEMNFFNK